MRSVHPDHPAETLPELMRAQADRYGDRPAVLGTGRAATYRELLGQVSRLAADLRAVGATPAHRIATVSSNGPEAAVAFLAATSVGQCAPLDPRLTGREIADSLDALGIDVVLLVGELDGGLVRAVAGSGVTCLEVAASERDTLIYDRFETTWPGLSARDPSDTCVVLRTSGTTSRPKLVPLTHANLLASASTVAATLRLTAEDRALNVMPLFHIHGLVAALLATLHSGGSVYCLPGADVRIIPEVLTGHSPTWYTGVPAIHHAVVDAAERADRPWRHRLRFIRSCSAPLPPVLLERVEAVFGVPVIEAYGMTEASHQVACNPLPPGRHKPGSVGTATGTEIRVVDAGGRPLPPGETGSVEIRGAGVMSGYLGIPTTEGFDAGWFRTGDEGFLDRDGYLYLRGRTKEIINRGGEKIFPHEIDEVLLSHPKVAEAATFALPHPRLGEEVAAAVVAREGTTPTEQELREHCAASVAEFKVPRLIAVVRALPRGPTGKLQRIGMAAALGLAERQAAGDEAAAVDVPPALAEIWTAALGQASVRPGGDFFLDGGDSLLSLRVVQEVNAAFGTTLEPSSLFRLGASPAAVARVLAEEQRQAAEPLRRVERSGRLPMPAVLRGMWTDERLGTVRNTVLALELRGPLRPDVLRSALGRLVARHESLRTRYPHERGVPYAVIDDGGQLDLPVVDADPAALPDTVAGLAAAPFDLGREWPIRATLVATGQDHHTLVIVHSHLASDAWSRRVVHRDLLAIYRELSGGAPAGLPTLPYQACDIADWQARVLRSRRAAQLAYWREVFADLPGPLSLVGPRSDYRPDRGVHRMRVGLDTGSGERFAARCRSVGLTEFEVLLAAASHALGPFAAGPTVVVGVPVCARNRPELTDQVGYYVSVLPVRVPVDGTLSVGSALEVSRCYRAALRNADVPLAEIVGQVDRRPARERRPLFDVVVKRDLEPHLPTVASPLDARVLDVPGVFAWEAVQIDLTTAVGSHRDIVMEYDPGRVEAAGVEEVSAGITAMVRDLATAGWHR